MDRDREEAQLQGAPPPEGGRIEDDLDVIDGKKDQLAGKYTREIVRMRKHYAAEYATVGVGAASGLVKPAQRAADTPATRGSARAGAQLRGKSEPRRTR